MARSSTSVVATWLPLLLVLAWSLSGGVEAFGASSEPPDNGLAEQPSVTVHAEVAQPVDPAKDYGLDVSFPIHHDTYWHKVSSPIDPCG